MSDLKLSVIVPVYNGAAYLERLITSIAHQNFSSMELILVDDGSTDDTWKLCGKFAEMYPWIAPFHTDNYGVSHARNEGIRHASGQWVHFMDADDTLAEGMYQCFAEVTEKYAADLIVCGCLRGQEKSETYTICEPEKSELLEYTAIQHTLQNLVMEQRYWLLDYIWNKWFRRDLIQTNNLSFSENMSLGEDFVFNCGYIQNVRKIYTVSKPFYEYRIQPEGLVSRFREAPWAERNRLYRAHRTLFRKMNLNSCADTRLIRQQAGQIIFGDIRTIEAENCPYTIKEKVQYIAKMLETDQYYLLRIYLRDQKHPAFQFYYWICSLKNAGWITAVIMLENRIRKLMAAFKKGVTKWTAE